MRGCIAKGQFASAVAARRLAYVEAFYTGKGGCLRWMAVLGISRQCKGMDR